MDYTAARCSGPRGPNDELFFHQPPPANIFLSRSFLDVPKDAFRRGKLSFPDSLAHLSARESFLRFLRKRRRREWVVYCKKPFGGPEQFLNYIGRYTHRVAISNRRITDLSDGRVVFKARDNHNPA
ncbi:MAG: transposase, partial [Syntrophobacter sp.]